MDIPVSDPSSSWSSGSHSGLVSIGPHSLFLSASGPPRKPPTQPAVIIETGLGSNSSEWVAVQRLVSQFARVYTYDRAGYGKSRSLDPTAPLPASAFPPTSKKRCQELTQLLNEAGVHPPWVLVGQSYGGFLIREFLLIHGKEKVRGMVIVDSSIERTKLPDDWTTLLGDVSYLHVVGLASNHIFSDEEWKHIQEMEEGTEGTAGAEEEYSEESRTTLNQNVRGKQLLGDGRLSVIFGNESVDFQKIYDWGVKHGNGTEEARVALKKRLEDMSEIDEKGHKEHLSLSSRSRLVYASGVASTHNVHYVQPELIADEVRWVLEGIDQ